MEVVEEKTNHRKTTVVRMAAVVFVALFITVGIHAGIVLAYHTKIYPGVHVGNVKVGGMSRNDATMMIRKIADESIENGLTFSVNESDAKVDMDVIAKDDPDMTHSIIEIDAESTATSAFKHGRSQNIFVNLFLPLVAILDRPDISAPVKIDKSELSRRILSAFPEYDRVPDPTSFMITKEKDVWRVAVNEGTEVKTLDIEFVIRELETDFSNLDTNSLNKKIGVPIITIKPEISLEEAVSLIPEAEKLLVTSPFTLSFTDQYDKTFSWQLDDKTLADILIPTKIGLGLDEEKLNVFLAQIKSEIDIKAQDARFEVSGSRASVFVPSREGREVNLEKTIGNIKTSVLVADTSQIAIEIETTKPSFELSQSNELGIKELLGTGVSSYAGSPTNRIKNIRNGVNLLNGILIPPGETFSLLSALSPFTTENGYLPELVIKGDKIEPETGGGLCQIGTTTFRATMMSGLEVVERRNHSLVVTYYNDQRNGNPGTDATIYNPYPDYKFKNDTVNYILFETEMNETKQELYFRFWGTNDGRKGSYSEPVVEKWIGAGEQRNIETTDLAPGTEKCQGAHPGAITSFTYTIENTDGSIKEKAFPSQYRALPKICLIGVEKIIQTETELEEITIE
jgi:vancomycin resistance protein YoaR